jgi:hypothetical protein
VAVVVLVAFLLQQRVVVVVVDRTVFLERLERQVKVH